MYVKKYLYICMWVKISFWEKTDFTEAASGCCCLPHHLSHIQIIAFWDGACCLSHLISSALIRRKSLARK